MKDRERRGTGCDENGGGNEEGNRK